MNQYYTGDSDYRGYPEARIRTKLFEWVENDLQSTDKEIIFIFGHTPCYWIVDDYHNISYIRENERRSVFANPEQRDLFCNLMKVYNVTAYFSGHSHAYSKFNDEGVWHINCGQSQGSDATVLESGIPSHFFDTFLNVQVETNGVFIDVWRDIDGDFDFQIEDNLIIPIQWIAIEDTFRFVVNSDSHAHFTTYEVFDTINQQINGIGEFLITTGDLSRRNRLAGFTYEQIKTAFGEDALWFPVIGNHEIAGS